MMYAREDLAWGICYKDEIKNILLALDLTNADAMDYPNTAEKRAYREGFEAAIRSVAAALGIRLISSMTESHTPQIIDLPARK